MRIIANLKLQPTESIDSKSTIEETEVTERPLDILNKKDKVDYDRGNLSNRELTRIIEDKEKSGNTHS